MEMHTRGCLARTIQLLSCNMFFLAVVCQYPAMDYPHVFWLTTTWGPLTTTISGFILSYTRLQPWLNRVCRGCNYLITRGAPSCNTVECFYFADLARPNEPNSKTPMPIRDALIACKHEWTQNICRFFFSVSHQKSIIQCHCFAKPRHSISSA